jgi:hypothetical protein
MSENRSRILAWVLYALLIVGVVTQLVIWFARFTGQPSLFEMVEAFGWGLGIPLVFAGLAALILNRQPANRVGWLMMIVALAVANPISVFIETLSAPPDSLTPGMWLLLWFDGWSWIPVIFPVFLIPLHFPSGRPPSRRWNWVNHLALGLWMFFITLTSFVDEIGPLEGNWMVPNPIGFISLDVWEDPLLIAWGIGLITVLTGSVVSLFVRYQRTHSAERQQIKWLLFAGAFFLIVYVFSYFITSSELNQGWGNLLFVLAILAMPVAIAVAILRYRLWDIDLIIRRTLQYSLLTGLLSLVYFGGVALLQRILTADHGRLTAGEGAVSGPPSAVVIVLTTLAIAALFNPLRRRVQDFIDRRFYRRKYDAEKALAEFAAAASRETDLAQLSERLTHTVQETLQPEQVGLLLVKTSASRND